MFSFQDLLKYYIECIEIESLEQLSYDANKEEKSLIKFPGALDRTVNFLRSTSNLFNVSITRARSILWVVGDRKYCAGSKITHLAKFIEFIAGRKYRKIDLPYSGFQSPWEKRFFEALVGEGYHPKYQYQAGPYYIDIAIIDGKKKLAVEVDGRYWHTTMSGAMLERDIVRDRNLKRMGWKVVRFWVHDLKYDIEKCVETVRDKVPDMVS